MKRYLAYAPALLAATLAGEACTHAETANPNGAFDEATVLETTAAVAIHPPTSSRIRPRETFSCRQHSLHAGDPVVLGDAAGIDCSVVRFTAGPGDHFPRAYEADGADNEDWYAWGAPLYAPFDGVIEEIHINPVTNRPGARGEGRASSIVIRRADGMRVVYAHVAEPRVAPGQSVTAGQTLAQIGNNGFSWYPHVHIGAWKDGKPVQITIDARALAALQRRLLPARQTSQ